MDADGLVVKIAKNMRRLLPHCVELADLMQEGSIGLLRAQRSYAPRPGCSFETYASHRVRGAMLDYLRAIDPLKRVQRKHATGGAALCWELPAQIVEPELPELPGTRARLLRAIEALPERERRLVERLFWDGAQGREVARELGVTPSRVIQLREQALARLRRRMQ